MGPVNPARAAPATWPAKSPSDSSHVRTVKPAPRGCDRARPCAPSSPTTRPSALINKSGRGACPHSAKAATSTGTPKSRRLPCHTKTQMPPSVISTSTAAGGVGMPVTAPFSPATHCATAKIQAPDSSISHSAGYSAPNGAKIAAKTPAAISADIAQTVSKLAKSP